MNEELARVGEASPAALAQVRAGYEGPWNFWNGVRTVFSSLAFVALVAPPLTAVGLAVHARGVYAAIAEAVSWVGALGIRAPALPLSLFTRVRGNGCSRKFGLLLEQTGEEVVNAARVVAVRILVRSKSRPSGGRRARRGGQRS
jgi:hypothetical protein